MSEEAIRRWTGRGWEEWFDLLDAWGAADRTHKEIARWVAKEHAIDGWDAQAVTVSYEVPVDQLFEAFTDESQRDRWLPEVGSASEPP